MNDYIKREDAIKTIKEYFVDSDTAISEHPDDVFRYNSGLQSALEAVFDIPSADVVERKHGEWIGKNGNRKRCLECGEFALYKFVNVGSFHEKQSNFCPHCGADMRGNNNEGD